MPSEPEPTNSAVFSMMRQWALSNDLQQEFVGTEVTNERDGWFHQDYEGVSFKRLLRAQLSDYGEALPCPVLASIRLCAHQRRSPKETTQWKCPILAIANDFIPKRGATALFVSTQPDGKSSSDDICVQDEKNGTKEKELTEPLRQINLEVGSCDDPG